MKPLKEHSKQAVKGEELKFSRREISTMVNQTFQNIKQLHLLADKVFSLVLIVKEQIMLKLIASSKKRLSFIVIIARSLAKMRNFAG